MRSGSAGRISEFIVVPVCAAARASRSGALDGAPKVKSPCQSKAFEAPSYFVAKHNQYCVLEGSAAATLHLVT